MDRHSGPGEPNTQEPYNNLKKTYKLEFVKPFSATRLLNEKSVKQLKLFLKQFSDFKTIKSRYQTTKWSYNQFETIQ